MNYTDLAQGTIQRFISRCARSAPALGEVSDVALGICDALQDLVRGLRVERGLVWISVPETAQLTVIQECIQDGSPSMIGTSLDSNDSGLFIVGFMNLPAGITEPGKQTRPVQINDGRTTVRAWREVNPCLKFSRNYSSTIIVGLQARGYFSGFLSFQSKSKRSWSPVEEATLMQVAECLGLFLSYELEIVKLLELTGRVREPL
jgi:hypothetical protein